MLPKGSWSAPERDVLANVGEIGLDLDRRPLADSRVSEPMIQVDPMYMARMALFRVTMCSEAVAYDA